jgi:hypothetical protein
MPGLFANAAEFPNHARFTPEAGPVEVTLLTPYRPHWQSGEESGGTVGERA